jgi:prolyl oligopeptidase
MQSSRPQSSQPPASQPPASQPPASQPPASQPPASHLPASYPAAPRQDLTEVIHGETVEDPYRWLEDAGSQQTRDWLSAQDELYGSYLAGLTARDRLAARLTELLGAGHVSPPVWRGERQFYTRREPGQEHAVLYTAAPGDEERVLVDLMAVDPSGATTLDYWSPSKDGSLLAYQLSEGGTEEALLRVIDTTTAQLVDGPIDRTRYSNVAWLPDGKAFYYGRRLAPDAVPAGEDRFHRRIYLHHLGTSPDEDVMILGDGLEKTNYYEVQVSRDGRWLIITAAAGTAPRTDVWVAALEPGREASPDLQVLQQGADANTWARPGRDGRIYLLTDADAPRGRVAVADPAHPAFPADGSWRDVITEDPEAVLTDYAILDGRELGEPLVLVARTRHAIGELTVHELATGRPAHTVPLPGLGTVGGLRERPEGGHEAWFAYTDHSAPVRILRFDAASGETDTWRRSPGTVNVPAIRAEQVPYTSADGTTVRMLILSADDQAGHRTPRPTILYGYGGFNVSLTPEYSASVLAWVEAGGVYAIAGLRGGSEEGEQWHRAGMRAHKQNVFDDFHAAAEKLTADGWTSTAQLAVMGGSNGGLLVGASVTQRPDLSAAAICSAPLLDMIRYEQFGLGETWNDEFGTAAIAGEFGWLRAYSPYHHVRDGVRYPAVLFTVFDGDTRVDTMHARKLCAALQHATSSPISERPVLLRREANVGHGARAVSRTVALSAEQLAFAAEQTGLSL